MDAEELVNVNGRRSRVYDFLGRVYEREIDEDSLLRMQKAREDMAKLTESTDEVNERIKHGLKLIVGYLESTANRKTRDVLLELAAEYADLFLGVKGTPPHPSESVYLNEFHPMYQRQRDEVLAIYRDEGVDKVKEFHEPEDHAALELQFMGYLCERTAEVSGKKDWKEARRLLELQRKFLDQHILKWMPKLAKDVVENAETDFYRGMAYLTDGYLEADRRTIDEILGELENVQEKPR